MLLCPCERWMPTAHLVPQRGGLPPSGGWALGTSCWGALRGFYLGVKVIHPLLMPAFSCTGPPWPPLLLRTPFPELKGKE